MSGGKVVLLTNMIAPYRIPLFNAIAMRCSDFHVVFLRKREAYRVWDVPEHEIRFSHEVLDSRYPSRSGSVLGCNPAVIQLLRKVKPKILIIGGWGYVENWLGLFYGKILGIPVILWGGMTANSYSRSDRLTDVLRKFFSRMGDAAVSYSSTAAAEFQRLGVPSEYISTGCNVGDVEFYFTNVRKRRADNQYPKEYAACRHPLFLFVGQLLCRKGLGPLLSAFQILGNTRNWGLILIGSGPDEEQLRRYCRENGLDNVFFAGFQQRQPLVRYFAISDVFILPSLREPGAIVLSEALASGLYVLASSYDGIAPDLISPGENGDFIDPSSIESLCKLLTITIERFHNEPWNRQLIAERFVQTQPVQRYARAFIEGMRLARENQLNKER